MSSAFAGDVKAVLVIVASLFLASSSNRIFPETIFYHIHRLVDFFQTLRGFIFKQAFLNIGVVEMGNTDAQKSHFHICLIKFIKELPCFLIYGIGKIGALNKGLGACIGFKTG